jgi:hypothetical protein
VPGEPPPESADLKFHSVAQRLGSIEIGVFLADKGGDRTRRLKTMCDVVAET